MRKLGWIIPNRRIKEKYKSLIAAGNNPNSEALLAFGIPYSYEKGQMKRKWIENLAPMTFEDTEFMAPVDTDECLKFLYEDYMTPPPEERRGNYHHIIKSDLGKYGNL